VQKTEDKEVTEQKTPDIHEHKQWVTRLSIFIRIVIRVCVYYSMAFCEQKSNFLESIKYFYLESRSLHA
jgi:hypothetical protein